MGYLVPDWELRSPEGDERLLLFAGSRLVLHQGSPEAPARLWRTLMEPAERQDCLGPLTVGRVGGEWVYAASIPEDRLPQGTETQELRRYLAHAPEDLWQQVSTAAQLLHWLREHRFCGRCGQTTLFHSGERALHCSHCDHNWYPRLSPCVIVVVRRGRQILLARAPHYPQGLYSLIAGFIEAGESAEEAVRREVAEETGLRVGNVRYRGSQSWPFPHQLMLGFSADYQGGNLVLQKDEILAADWYDPDNLPLIPGEYTIAGQLIRRVIGDLA